jgi:hypothetical protein
MSTHYNGGYFVCPISSGWVKEKQDGTLIHLDDPITAGPDSTRAEFQFLVHVPQPQGR